MQQQMRSRMHVVRLGVQFPTEKAIAFVALIQRRPYCFFYRDSHGR